MMKQLLDRKLEEWFLVAGFFSLILLVFTQFLSRYVFNYSLSWPQELSRYLLIWLAWISVSFTIREQQHIRVETFKNALPKKFQKVIEVIVCILWGFFAIFLAIVGTQFVWNIYSSGQGSPMIGIPMWIVYLILPIAGFLIVARLVQQFVFIMKKEPL